MTENNHRLLDQVRQVNRVKDYSLRTEEFYINWIKEKAKSVMQKAVGYLPAHIVGESLPRRIFPELMVTSASAIKKKVSLAKRFDVPNKFIIQDFEWRRVTEFVQEGNLHPTIIDVFVLGKHYTETEQWKTMIGAVDDYVAGKISNPSKHDAYWCKSRKDVERYFEILLECYQSMKSNGYKTQRQLFEERGMLNAGGVVRYIGDEIEVLINGCGDLVFSSLRGNHRFSIAQVLNIQHLPVVLGGVDATYLRKISISENFSCRRMFDKCVTSHEALEYFG